MTVSGTKGCFRVSDFVLPFFGNEAAIEVTNASFEVAGCDFNMEERCSRTSVAEYSNSHPTSQETNLFRNFSSQVQSGKLNEAWPDMAFKTQQVMNACFESARAGSRLVDL